jgi:hypothetical protein
MILSLAFLAALILTLCLAIARHDARYRASYDHNKETPPKGYKP